MTTHFNQFIRTAAYEVAVDFKTEPLLKNKYFNIIQLVHCKL